MINHVGVVIITLTTPLTRDVSMLLNDPYAQYSIGQTIIGTLVKMVTTSELPRVSTPTLT